MRRRTDKMKEIQEIREDERVLRWIKMPEVYDVRTRADIK